ncbi:MAG: PTS sugar transporter subunit IIA [Gemmatimonadota bacterium]|nr:MAG: PTS sugar transporter subunit IIA [Gemmatimonadota bacterium]
MRLADYLRPELILSGLDADDAESTIRALSHHLTEQRVVEDGAEVCQALMERERLHTTAVGHGVAIPHATVNGVAATILLVAVAPEAIRFGPPESDPCQIFFLLLSPPGQESEHVKLLARLSRLVRHPGFVEKLGGTRSTDDVLDAIREVDAQHV